MQPLGMQGRKTIADLLREASVEAIHRFAWPILADEEGAVWIAGIRVAERCRIDREKRDEPILRLLFQPAFRAKPEVPS